MKIKVGCSMSIQGAELEDEIEMPDDATNDEIEAEVREWALEQFEWYWTQAETSPHSR